MPIQGNAILWDPAWGPKELQQDMYVHDLEIHDYNVDVIRSGLSAHKALPLHGVSCEVPIYYGQSPGPSCSPCCYESEHYD